MSDYVPLLEALEGHFEQSLDELPAVLRRPVAELFYPLRWDDCDPEYRRRFVERFDTRPSPEASEEERQFVENLFALEDECVQEITDLGNIVCSSVSEHDLKKTRIANAKQKLAQIKLQRCQARGDYLEADDSAAESSPCQSVDAAQIISNFRVIKDEDKNEEWWRSKTREAKRNGLVTCRVGSGKQGPGGGSQWRPDLIAAWLIDRNDRGREGLNSSAAAAALRKFPGCADIADSLFPPEKLP
jgi:hypothetical protein